jgi:hypothetical protein
MLQETIQYNPQTGKFHWKVHTPGRTMGSEAKGTVTNRGYIHIRVNKTLYLAHRLGWYLTYGVWPKELDHKNRIGTDNRLENLREVTHVENMANRPRKGYYWNKKLSKWHVQAKRNGNKFHLGYFTNELEAKSVVQRFWMAGGLD